jgi:hypothetical protein
MKMSLIEKKNIINGVLLKSHQFSSIIDIKSSVFNDLKSNREIDF